MRALFVTLVLALGGGLALGARFDPALPFLPPGGGLAWWAHPEPLFVSGRPALGPHRLRYRFTPARAGTLRIAAMSRYRLLDRDRVLASTPGRGSRLGGWKQPRAVEVPARPLEVEAEDPRLLPVLGLGGPAAPAEVEVVRDGRATPARRAPSSFDVRPGLAPRYARLARLALLGSAGLFLALLLFPPGDRAARPRPRPWLLGLILAGHTAILAWNLRHYPLERGGDAEGHLEYVRLIRTEGRLPAPERGWQTYQPPLYHLAGALVVARTGTERSLQVMSGVAGLLLVLVVALAACGAGAHWRPLLLVAAWPALLVTEPQAVNEVWFALLGSLALVAAAAGRTAGPGRALLAGLLAGLALLTRYTGVFVLLAALAALLIQESRPFRARGRDALIALAAALAVGGWPYLQRLRLHGDPFIGNWDDALGHPYRQPPGFRTPSYFLRFGASLLAHPFRAREASLWDSLYVGSVSDGFGRLITTPLQQALACVLPWLALPLVAVLLLGLLVIGLGRRGSFSRLEVTSVLLAVLVVGALIRYNLELPYYSTAKGVFLLVLAIPAALAFERGRLVLGARGGRLVRLLLDLDLVAFALLAGFTFCYRG